MGVLCEGIHGAHNCLTSGKAQSGKSGRTCLASLWDLRNYIPSKLSILHNKNRYSKECKNS